MRHRWLLLALLLVAPACATILGIDEGTPREDASVDATVDLFVPDVAVADVADVELDAGQLSVPCGDAGACVVGQTTCCRKGSNPNFTYSCVAEAGACTGANPHLIPCDRAALCAGFDAGPEGGPPVCCADTTATDAGTVLASVLCLSEKACLATGSIMCSPVVDAGDAGCPSPKLCKANGSFVSGYNVCQ